MIRSRATFLNENEKNSKYFLNLEKRNYNTKCIKKLLTDKGSITDEKDILKEEKRFYQNLYNSNKSTIDTADLINIENQFLQTQILKS